MFQRELDSRNIGDWCDIRTAAAYLHVSVGFLRKAVRLKRVPFARAGTKALRFRRSDLDRWLQANGCPGEFGLAEQRKSR